jgi:hypothetical protein
MAACTTDDTEPEDRAGAADGSTEGTAGDGTESDGTTTDTGGTSGSETGTGGAAGSSSGDGTGGSTSACAATICASPTALDAATPGIADFEAYDGSADLSTWSFALGGDSSTGVVAGPYAYGDEADGNPETFEAVEGPDSTYALSISDSLAEEFGGGVGLWLSGCLDLTAFTGISFWARGSVPLGEAKLVVSMEETTSETPDEYDNCGTCPGAADVDPAECVHPSYMFSVTDTWTEFRVPWSAFTAGDAFGTTVAADGHNIWQLQFGVELEWLPDESGTYVGTPAPYELAIDDLAFYVE